MTVSIPEKPFAPACERNKMPILTVLQKHLQDADTVLEIGSGTGQHAVFLAKEMPHLQWQCSDLPSQLEGMQLWIDDSGLENLCEPVAFDVAKPFLHDQRFSAIFTANTLHIVSWQQVQALFDQVQTLLQLGGKFCIYGPFNYHGQFTSDSNAEFDQWLKARNSQSGIRDFESVQALAEAQGLALVEDVAMPANNRLLVWKRIK